MKISRYGSQGSGKGSSKGAGERAERFRRRYRIGETVSGKLVRWERPGLAWVNFEGQILLARLNSSPPLGERLLFLIKTLSPDIHLQELHPAGTEARAGDAGRTFVHARVEFDAGPWSRALARILASAAHSRERRRAFFSLLKKDDAAAAAWVKGLRAVTALSRALDRANAGRAAWMPWLIPDSERMEMLCRPRHAGKQGHEILMGFRVPGLGACRALFTLGREDREFRLALPGTVSDEAAARLKQQLMDFPQETIPCAGISELPPSSSPGPLADLLAGMHRSEGYGTTGLNLKA